MNIDLLNTRWLNKIIFSMTKLQSARLCLLGDFDSRPFDPVNFFYSGSELLCMYSARNLEMSICFSLKSRPSERFHRPEMSQIKAEISLRTNVKLNFHKDVGCQ